MLHKQYDEIHNEMDIVRRYIEFFENGFNSKTILQDFIEAQNKIKELTETLRTTQSQLKNKLESKEKKLKETNLYLKNLQSNVVKPLLKEYADQNKLVKRLLDQ